MYVAYAGKKEVLLWCTADNDKRSCVSDKVDTPCKCPKGGHDSHIDKMAAIEENRRKVKRKVQRSLYRGTNQVLGTLDSNE